MLRVLPKPYSQNQVAKAINEIINGENIDTYVVFQEVKAIAE